jgi:hypothetical protein
MRAMALLLASHLLHPNSDRAVVVAFHHHRARAPSRCRRRDAAGRRRWGENVVGTHMAYRRWHLPHGEGGAFDDGTTAYVIPHSMPSTAKNVDDGGMTDAPSGWSGGEGDRDVSRIVDVDVDDDGTNAKDDGPDDVDVDVPSTETILCRVVAASDGKISRPLALKSMSDSSISLLNKVELLYEVESRKVLGGLSYMSSPRCDGEGAGGGIISHEEEERKLVSVLNRSLTDGGYRLMDARDLDLCSALNAGYLLRLSLLPDIRDLECVGREFHPGLYDGKDEDDADCGRKDAPLPFGGRVLVYWRGYTREITTGRLLLPKLDYLQASLVQRSSAELARRFGEFERKVDEYVRVVATTLFDAAVGARRRSIRKCRDFVVDALENFGLSENEYTVGLVTGTIDNRTNGTMDDTITTESLQRPERTSFSRPSHDARGNRIFKFARYLTSTSTIIASGLDLNDALSPFLLCESSDEMAGGGNNRCLYDAPGSRRNSAVRLLERISIQNTVDFFSKEGRRNLVRNYFRSSTLVEPAYEEVVVVWRPHRRRKPIAMRQFSPPTWLYKIAEVYDMEDRLPERKNRTRDDNIAVERPLPLEIKAFNDVPMANIEAVLPKTKLIFRPADAIVFDLVSVFSFLAVAGSFRFDSPKLDLIALVSLIFFAVRTFFRYSNKYARYDLLVNKFITSKVSHRGPGKSIWLWIYVELASSVSIVNISSSLVNYTRSVEIYCV